MDPKEIKKKSKKMKEDFSKFKVTTSGDFMGQNIHEAFDKIIKTDFAIFMINDDWLKDHRAMQECYTAAMREIPYVVLINSDMKLKTEIPVFVLGGNVVGTINVYDNDLKAATKFVDFLMQDYWSHIKK